MLGKSHSCGWVLTGREVAPSHAEPRKGCLRCGTSTCWLHAKDNTLQGAQLLLEGSFREGFLEGASQNCSGFQRAKGFSEVILRKGFEEGALRRQNSGLTN